MDYFIPKINILSILSFNYNNNMKSKFNIRTIFMYFKNNIIKL